jgi:hypothetical protein
MDERLEKALNVANFMATFNNQRELIKQEYKEHLIYHYNGYRFTVSLELMNFINLNVLSGINQIILIDDNENPCIIEDIENFSDDINDVYYQATNQYHQKFNELKKQRSVFKLTLE